MASSPYITLGEDEVVAFSRGFQYHVTPRSPTDFEPFLAAARGCRKFLSPRLSSALTDFRERGNEHAFLFITGIPPEMDLLPTPNEGRNSAIPVLSAFRATVLASFLGEPVGYCQESEGSVLQSVFPTRSNEHCISSQSSCVELTWHTELAFHPYNQDWLVLTGLRADRAGSARTSILSFRKLLPLLSPNVLHELRQANFRNGIDPSFGVASKRGFGPRIAIISGDRVTGRIRYDADLLDSLTVGAREALHELEDLIAREPSAVSSVEIVPGSILLIDNRWGAHARTAFRAYYDGLDRWLIRVGVRRSLEDCRPALLPSSRSIWVDFSIY